MADWVLVAIIAGLVVVMFALRRRDRERLDWESLRLMLKRRNAWAGKTVRTSHRETITVERSDLTILQNAKMNMLIAERDVNGLATFLETEGKRDRAAAIDEAERLTGREYLVVVT
jgi:hypothetical protein